LPTDRQTSPSPSSIAASAAGAARLLAACLQYAIPLWALYRENGVDVQGIAPGRGWSARNRRPCAGGTLLPDMSAAEQGDRAEIRINQVG